MMDTFYNSLDNTETYNESEVLEDLQGIPENDENVTTVEELLINCVMARPPLWDSRLSIEERSKTIRDDAWLQIYEEFGNNPQFSVEFLIKKWRNLRDTYVRLKGEYSPSGSSAKKKKKWEFFDLMTFLNDSISYRPTTSNIKSHIMTIASSPLAFPANSLLDESEEQKPISRKEQTPVSRKKQSEIPLQKMESAILETFNKINAPLTEPLAPSVNPICIRISEMLSQMPQNARTVLEIKLLQVAYEGAKDFLLLIINIS